VAEQQGLRLLLLVGSSCSCHCVSLSLQGKQLLVQQEKRSAFGSKAKHTLLHVQLAPRGPLDCSTVF
jgi:hypothetical protein